MNKNLEDIIKIYSTKSHKEVSNTLLDYSKDSLVALFLDLLTMYINDKNSSTLREFLTVSLAGYTHNTKKIGFNGFRQSVNSSPIHCEAKPKNLNTQDFNISGKKNGKLNACGNFTDYTWARFEKDKASNLNMLVSGFIDGQLIYILEFPFNCPSFLFRLEEQLKKHFPNGDKSGEYLRSATFTFQHFCDFSDLKRIYVLDKEKLTPLKPYINSKLFDFLIMEDNND